MNSVSLTDIALKWPAIQSRVREALNMLNLTYSTWIEPLKPYSLKEDTLYVSFPNDSANEASANFVTLHLTKHYAVCFQVALEEMFERVFHIQFIIEPEKNDRLLFQAKKELTGPQNYPSTKLNPKYTFDEFVQGKSNQFAHAAALAVAENPGKEFNPLFIHGGPGLGKTHLMNAIAGYILNADPSKKVIYVNSEDFTNELIASLRDQNRDSMEYFKNKYRNVDALLIDDIQFIIGRGHTEEEFFHTFNYLYENKKQIVLSSDKPPRSYSNLEERLRSRFMSGLSVEITSPDYETRMAILEKKQSAAGYTIDNEILQYIANHIKTNIRDLEGALNMVHYYSGFHPNTNITIDVAKNILKDIINPDEDLLTPEQIVNAVADQYGIRPQDITSKKQNREVVFPRQIAIYLLRLMLDDLTLKDIGRIVGGKDHTTVSYSYEKVSKLVTTDENVRNVVNILRKKLKN